MSSAVTSIDSGNQTVLNLDTDYFTYSTKNMTFSTPVTGKGMNTDIISLDIESQDSTPKSSSASG